MGSMHAPISTLRVICDIYIYVSDGTTYERYCRGACEHISSPRQCIQQGHRQNRRYPVIVLRNNLEDYKLTYNSVEKPASVPASCTTWMTCPAPKDRLSATSINDMAHPGLGCLHCYTLVYWPLLVIYIWAMLRDCSRKSEGLCLTVWRKKEDNSYSCPMVIGSDSRVIGSGSVKVGNFGEVAR